MDNFMIAIIVLLVLLIVTLLALTIMVGVGMTGSNNSSNQKGIQIYFDGYSDPLYMEQFTTPLTITIGTDQEAGGVGFSDTVYVSQINSIPASVYNIAKQNNFILPCKIIQMDSDGKNKYVQKIAVFYDNGEDSGHFVQIQDDEGQIKGLQFDTIGSIGEMQQLPTLAKIDIKLKLNGNKVELQGSDGKKLSEADSIKKNIILENCIWPYNSNPIYLLYPLKGNNNNLLNPKEFRGFAYNIGNSGKWYQLFNAIPSTETGNESKFKTKSIYGQKYYYKFTQ